MSELTKRDAFFYECGRIDSALTSNTDPTIHVDDAPVDAEITKLKELLPVWVSVDERLPEKKCIATYLNSHDKRRTIIAIYCPRFTIESCGEADDYDEYLANDDMYYFREGWYECQENRGEYAMIYVNEGEVTHWMPLPPAPSDAAK